MRPRLDIELLGIVEACRRIVRIARRDQLDRASLGENVARPVGPQKAAHTRNLERASAIQTTELRNHLTCDQAAATEFRLKARGMEQLLDKRAVRKTKKECVVVRDIDDDAIALGLDAKFVVVKVHRPRIELVPLRYVWRMESVLGVAAGHRNRRDKMLRVEPFV